MQKPIKRGDAWRIQVKYKHLRDAGTGDTLEECIIVRTHSIHMRL